MVGTLSLAGDGIEVTVQGLKFTQNLLVNQAAAVRLLQNDFAAGNILLVGTIGAASSPPDAGPSAVIVGNRLASGVIQEPNDYSSRAFYIAGNILVSGYIQVRTPAWIVGNEVGNYTTSPYRIYAYAGWVRILANRIRANNSSPYDYTTFGAIMTESPYSLVANNIIDESQESCPSCGYSYVTVGIMSKGPGYAVIVNNIVRGMGTPGLNRYGHAIVSQTPVARVSGNIVLDFAGYSGTSSYYPISANPGSELSNNLCYESSGDCPAGNGNLNADPRLVDLVDYRLAPNSPAIDAGPDAYEFADLDRTRKDIGVHGGPWSIGQYDAQRDPYNFTPYVYPLVSAGWFPGSGTSGTLEVQAIGVARLR